MLQKALNMPSYYQTGNYLSKTQEAVALFQQANGITAENRYGVGPITRARLNAKGAVDSNTGDDSSNDSSDNSDNSGDDSSDNSTTIHAADNFQARLFTEMKDGIDSIRSKNSNVKIVLGEFATPNECKNNTNNEQTKWNSMLKYLYNYATTRDVNVAWWAFGHENDQYDLNTWTKKNGSWRDNDTASAYEDVLKHSSRVYHNYAGNEFYSDKDHTPPQWGSGLPNNAPTVTDLRYFKNKGVDSIRYPLGQPGSHADWLANKNTKVIDPIFIGHVENVLNRAQSVGLKVVLDVLHPGNGNDYASIHGNSLKTTQGLNDYKSYVKSLLNHGFSDNNGNWTTVKNHPAFEAIDIVNEPHSGGVGDISNSQWESISQNIVTWLRNDVHLPNSKTIWVTLNQYGGLQSASSNHPNGFWINDPGHNVVAAPHYYPELDHNGSWVNPGDNTYIPNQYSNAVSASGAWSGKGDYNFNSNK